MLAVTNLYPSPDRPGYGSFVYQQVEGVRRAGAEVEVLYINRRINGIRTYVSASEKVRAAIASFRPDLVHIHYGGVLAFQALRAVGRLPVVITFRGSDLMGAGPAGFAARFRGRISVAISRWVSKRVTKVVAVSKSLADRLPEGVKAEIIPSGIDLDRFRPLDREDCRRQLGWPSNEFCVAFQNNNDAPMKRQWIAEAAVREANALGLPARLRVIKGLKNEEVPTWLNAADALLVTSSHEGSPNIVREALACGLPIVSVDVGDVAERLAGIEGCHIESSTPRALAERLCEVSKGPKRIDGSSAVAPSSLDRISERLIEVYRGAVAQAASSSA